MKNSLRAFLGGEQLEKVTNLVTKGGRKLGRKPELGAEER